MARLKIEASGKLEQLEGKLAALGNARVYLRLVSERINAAARMSDRPAMLAPALDDLCQVDALIRQVQVQLSADEKAQG